MRKLLRWICRRLGMRTWYHVAATYQDSSRGQHIMSTTVYISPWLHIGNYDELMEYLQAKERSNGSPVAITSITRLGP